MPLYDYRCSSCGHTFTKKLMIADRKSPISESCPECGITDKIDQVILSAPATADPVRIGVTKQDSGFKEVLQSIHEKNRGSTLNTYL